ncbi:MAG: M48 family metallopeptidase [Desulfobacteraceae bacterium]|nr:M48 family metallopeptidase [Desulfobacteraceae bacterium]MBC2757238.1 M48 family metallopeptidase [Desulfobacteraceae bacterium]
MKKKKVLISGIGEVLLEQSIRAKHMNLSIRPFRGVRVAVPKGVSFESAEAFARSKSQWIIKHLPKLKAIEHEAARCQNDSSAGRIDRKTAKSKLTQRLDSLSAKSGLPYNRVFVKNQKTRWGSCSEKKNINLNINLVRLPEKLMDYAIMHELVHTKILNHSSQFWDLLEKFVKDAKGLDRELQQYSLFLVR